MAELGIRVLSVDSPMERMLYGRLGDLRNIAGYLPIDDRLAVLQFIESCQHSRDDEKIGVTVSIHAAEIVERLMAER